MSSSNLPERASLEYLRKLAKQRLQELRATDPRAKLAAAQLAVAREHGLPSWRALRAEVERRREEQLAAFFEACARGELETVRRLLERGADPNVRDRGDNAYPLHFAAGNGHTDVVRVLLDAGGDVHGIGDVHEADVIGWATVLRSPRDIHRDVLALLLERGARHHIFSAIAVGDLALIQKLVEDNPEALDRRMSRFEQRRTPLHFAARLGRYDIVDLLIDLGADLEAEDQAGHTALATAMLRGDGEAAAPLMDVNVA